MFILNSNVLVVPLTNMIDDIVSMDDRYDRYQDDRDSDSEYEHYLRQRRHAKGKALPR